MDTEDFEGPLTKIFDDSLAFIMRNLHKVQAGRGVNYPGTPEIPQTVFEELLVNALVHRDYLVSAPIRIFIYDNRIEIISPGHLPNNLTVEKIREGNSNIRNPILVSFVAKGLLPYHGLASGIKRALSAWNDIEFVDNRDGCLFTCIVKRKALSETDIVTVVKQKMSEKMSEKIISIILENPHVSAIEIAIKLGKTSRTVERKLAELKNNNCIRRIGPAKGGYWEVISS